MLKIKIKIILLSAFASAIIFGLVYMPSVHMQNVSTQDELPAKQEGRIIEGSWIVILKDDFVGGPPAGVNISTTQLQKQNETITDKALEVNETISQQGGNVTNIYTRATNGFAVSGVSNPFVLMNDSAVESVEPSLALPLDTQYQSTGIGRIGLNQAVTPSLRPDNRETKMNVDVAVVDTYVWDHADLNIYRRVSFVSTDRTVESHGTHVAGLCCARDNLGGVVGPAQGARIWGLEICGVTCSTSSRLGALDYIVSNANEIDVATMSCCGGGVNEPSFFSAIEEVVNAGVTYFRSAGNTGTGCEDNWGCEDTNAIVVGALTDFDGLCGRKDPQVLEGDRDDSYPNYSTYGSQIDILAPGTYVGSTWPAMSSMGDGRGFLDGSSGFPYIGNSEHGWYAYQSGTSMATPLAAGVGAMLSAVNPSWTPAQVRSSILSNDYSQTLGCDGKSKGGIVSPPSPDGVDSVDIIWAGNY